MSINRTPRDQQQDSLRQSQMDCDRPVREVQQIRLRSTNRQVVRAYRDISRVTAERANRDGIGGVQVHIIERGVELTKEDTPIPVERHVDLGLGHIIPLTDPWSRVVSISTD